VRGADAEDVRALDAELCLMTWDLAGAERLLEGLAREGFDLARQERRALLGRQLALKFGPSDARAATIAALSPEQLELAAALILSADSEAALLAALA
jgi:hypothetical protein